MNLLHVREKIDPWNLQIPIPQKWRFNITVLEVSWPRIVINRYCFLERRVHQTLRTLVTQKYLHLMYVTVYFIFADLFYWQNRFACYLFCFFCFFSVSYRRSRFLFQFICGSQHYWWNVGNWYTCSVP